MINRTLKHFLNFIKSVEYGDTQIIFFQKNSNKIDLNAIVPSLGLNALMVAIYHKRFDLLFCELLVSEKVNVNIESKTNLSPFMISYELMRQSLNENRKDDAELFKQTMGKIVAHKSFDFSVLLKNNFEYIKIFIENGLEHYVYQFLENNTITRSQSNLLIEYALTNNFSILGKILIEKEKNDCLTEYEINFIEYILDKNRTISLDLINQNLNEIGIYKIDPNSGFNFLTLALYRRKYEVIELLLKHPNINVNTPDGNGNIPFLIAHDIFKKDKPTNKENNDILGSIYGKSNFTELCSHLDDKNKLLKIYYEFYIRYFLNYDKDKDYDLNNNTVEMKQNSAFKQVLK